MPSGLSIEYINPFIEAVIATCQTVCSVEVQRQPIQLKSDRDTTYGVHAIVSISGEATGALVLCFPEATALKAVASLGTPGVETLSAAAISGMSELSGMIVGDASNRLSSKGFAFDFSTPRLVIGRHHVTALAQATPPLVVPFSSVMGPFWFSISVTKG